jgi:hypothetical protein
MLMRRRPAYSSGAAASLLIAPRTFSYVLCWVCLRDLFFTYVGEDCPFCETPVVDFIAGDLPPAEEPSGARGQLADGDREAD